MLGKRILYDLTNEHPILPATQSNRGRSKALIERRNDIMFHRYYFYSRMNKIEYEATIARLSEEFLLSSTTIIEILIDKSQQVRTIVEKKMDKKQLESLFPHYCWDINKLIRTMVIAVEKTKT